MSTPTNTKTIHHYIVKIMVRKKLFLHLVRKELFLHFFKLIIFNINPLKYKRKYYKIYKNWNLKEILKKD